MPARGGRLWGGSLDPGARPAHHGALDPGLGLSGPGQPPAWENPGLLPGATAPARQSGGRGFPESAQRPPSRHWTESARIWSALPLRQRGKPRRTLLGGATPAHCAYRPRHPAPRCWEAGQRPRPGLSNPAIRGLAEGLDTRAGIAICLGRAGEVTQRPKQVKQQRSGGIPVLSSLHPPGLEKKTTGINKEPFFFLLK